MAKHNSILGARVALLTLLFLSLALLAALPGAVSEARAASPPAAAAKSAFWVVLRSKADVESARAIQRWSGRGRAVVQRLQETATASQAALRQLLRDRKVEHRPFWIVNAIWVKGDAALLKELANRPEVERIVPDEPYRIPSPPKVSGPHPQAIEWNIDRIGAPQVWSAFGVKGEGIVVASIDSGVQFDHPALVAQYRGRREDGSFDHDYNWFDPDNQCGSPSRVPCDDNGHGTHTMGTMVGDDGNPGPNQIGVAPRARWMTAKACDSGGLCPSTALLAAGQWMLAPTDLSGNNPRPDLRPHVINNSWSGGTTDPFFRSVVQAWVAAGIFPVFAAGNAGPECGSAAIPGAYPEGVAVGAFDINNNIAGFSARGPSAFEGVIKPNVAAPGVEVRSSLPPNQYGSISGTSMAAPHLAGTLALIWSAAPALVGDVAATRALVDQTAIDVSDLSCAGTPGNNNVWGEGRLDAFGAVDHAPRGDVGTLAGTVTDASTGAPIAGVTILATGPFTRTVATDSAGHFTMLLPVGSYRVTASAFGYLPRSVSDTVITAGSTATVDFALALAPTYQVSGRVLDSTGGPIEGATVTLLGTPLPPAITDASGAYRFGRVPAGEYNVRAEAGPCYEPSIQRLVVDADKVLDFSLVRRADAYGYFCRSERSSYVETSTVLPLTGDDNAIQVSLPFSFTLYGKTYTAAYVSTNGFLNFLALNSNLANVPIPNTFPPNAAIYPFWDDLYVDAAASVRTMLLGDAPNRQFVIEWRNVAFCCVSQERVSFEVVLFENGQILMQYRDLSPGDRAGGGSATVGLENESGTVGFQYSFGRPVLFSGLAVRYLLPPNGFVQGVVRDANDRQPIAGATVRALRAGTVVREVTTDATGFYRMQLFLGEYTVEASASNYQPERAQVTLSQDGEVVTRDWTLATARAELSPSQIEIIIPRGQVRRRSLLLRNTGSLALDWELKEAGGSQARTPPSSLERLEATSLEPNAYSTQGLFGASEGPGWSASEAGRVLRSWPTTGLDLPWGVGFNGNVWLSDPPTRDNHEFTPTGAATGRRWHAGWAGDWPGDMAYDLGRGLMCQVNVGGDNGIYCWNPASGNVESSITGSFPWTGVSQRGLAYREDDDSFYIGGWNQGIIYHIRGLSHPNRGEVIGQCSPPDGTISGLAWNPSLGILWVATNSPTDTIYEINPETCTVLATLPHPNPGFNGAGLEMDEVGNLWTVSQGARTAYLMESGVPAFRDVPWISETPSRGTLAPGASQRIDVTIDTTGLEPGVYLATLYLRSNSGRQPLIPVRVSLIVSAYLQGVNAGGGGYVDRGGSSWAADRRYSPGAWGYRDRSYAVRTRSAISGTDDDPLYQSARRGHFEYRFDRLPEGVYQVELKFAEIEGRRRNQRIFDVIVQGALVLPAHDIAGDVGRLVADRHSFFTTVTDGTLRIRFVPRKGFGEPLVNALRVTHRPDR